MADVADSLLVSIAMQFVWCSRMIRVRYACAPHPRSMLIMRSRSCIARMRMACLYAWFLAVSWVMDLYVLAW